MTKIRLFHLKKFRLSKNYSENNYTRERRMNVARIGGYDTEINVFY